MRKISLIYYGLPYYFGFSYWRTNYKKIGETFFVIFGIIWTFIEAAKAFNVNITIPSLTQTSYFLFLLVALVISIVYNYPKLIREVVIANTDIKIELVVANYLKLNGDKVLATNSTFDTTHIDNFISPKSIQGQFFKKHYANISHLDKDIEDSLANETPKYILNRTRSKNKQYNIGTVAKLTHSKPKPFIKLTESDAEFRTYWLAMADVNEYGKPICDFETFQTALAALWEYIATKGHLENLVIPILGSGRTGINERREKILQEIIFSFVAFASEKKLTEKLTIAIHPKDLLKHKIDFQELCGFIEYTCKYKSSKNSGKSHGI